MIDPKQFLSVLEKHGVRFFAGVPDSLLQSLCAELLKSVPAERHIIAANEGAAIGLAAGWHLATASTPCVYMQNSGLGNAVNPLVSLADPHVYSIPMLLLVGWRGEILDGHQVKDEPQHAKQGLITLDLLRCLDIPYAVLGPGTDNFARDAEDLLRRATRERRPTALVIRKDTFTKATPAIASSDYPLRREQALELLVEALPAETIIVATTGKLSRELYEIRLARDQTNARDFLVVGSMGHSVQIASGIALAQPQRRVTCIDGDGAVIMHMGGLTTSATISNLMHIVINNGAHESVGGQPTQALRIDVTAIARACGYGTAARANAPDAIRAAIRTALASPGSSFLEIRTNTGARENLGRPKDSPVQSKLNFMHSIGQTQPGTE